MLVRFICENFLSFKEELEFSMIATSYQEHNEHKISNVVKYKDKEDSKTANLLKGNVIFGANASGKSNLIRAIEESKQLITMGVNYKAPTLIIPNFKLVAKNKKPTKFEYEFIHNDIRYTYGFAIINDIKNEIKQQVRIVEEYLYQAEAYKDHIIFKRETNEKGETKINLENLIKKKKGEEKKKYEAIEIMGTRPEQLFLTELRIKQDPLATELIEKYFGENLLIINTNSRLVKLESKLHKNKELKKFISNFISSIADTGIKEIKTKNISFDELNLSSKQLNKILDDLQSINTPFEALLKRDRRRMEAIKNREGKEELIELLTIHKCNKIEKEFGFYEESDGTRRLFDLLPLLFEAINQEKTFVIDEINRSLHPDLVRAFIKLFYKYSKKGSQLIFTTHDRSLMDETLFRRDEISLMQKDKNQNSNIMAISDYKIRGDLKLSKAYEKGRFAGVPNFSGLENKLFGDEINE